MGASRTDSPASVTGAESAPAIYAKRQKRQADGYLAQQKFTGTMSALGQKRTRQAEFAMSAYHQKRTSLSVITMSA
jgi:hypothetical protein